MQKVIARAGVASRREAERWIADGRLRINGQKATIGDRVSDSDTIQLDGRKLRIQSADTFTPRIIAYHKPEGEICSRKDPEGRRTVFSRLPKVDKGRWIAIGRLDYNTSGLLLFTNDGDVANKLMHPSSGIDREYMVRVMGRVDDAMIQRLKEGVLLEDGMARFTDIVEADKESESINRWFYVCLMEGRNREVRRLWESQDVTVNRLKRVRFGPIFIPAKLRQGQCQELTEREIADLLDAADQG
ncbi:MAG: pseudouridine synthase [Cellvibrionales bacterium]|nr:pseudouridine synthase [Cellvibrionales bacterium]